MDALVAGVAFDAEFEFDAEFKFEAPEFAALFSFEFRFVREDVEEEDDDEDVEEADVADAEGAALPVTYLSN